jgi:uncharacterized protein YkwD
MKKMILIILLFAFYASPAQLIDSLNTAKDCNYMTKEEKEMIYEINQVRSNPQSYLKYITPLLEEAQKKLKDYGKGSENYSLTFTSTTKNGKATQKIDTTWHYTNEEEVKALSTLAADLKKLKSLSVLKPDRGIYNAAKKHAKDQHAHDWKLMHTGSDGSDPWDRVTKFSPSMSFGNENIAGSSASPTPRDIVLQLLIDSGIPGYGHRYNMLDPQWTHVACTGEKYKNYMYWWIQDFGVQKKK